MASTTSTISRSLRQRIRSGQWTGGHRISEAHLIKEFQACRSTVGKSLKMLEEEGLIWSRQGKGRFVQEFSKRRTGRIGVVLLNMRHLDHPVTARGVAGMQSVLAESGDHLKLSALNDRVVKAGATVSARVDAAIEAIEPNGLDVVILATQQAPVLLVERLLEHLPVVWVHNSLSRPGLVGVKVDAIAATYLATQQLQELGHQRIVLVNSPPAISQVTQEIWDGYRLAMGANVAQICSCGVLQEQTEAEARRQAEPLLRRSPNDRPTAFLCGMDEAAMGVYQAATELGLSVPGDLSIMGWHDVTVHRPSPMAWSGISVDYWQMGRVAAEQALKLREHPQDSGVAQVDAKVTIGQSSGPAPRANTPSVIPSSPTDVSTR